VPDFIEISPVTAEKSHHA